MKAHHHMLITTATCCLFLMSCGGEDESGETVEECDRYEVEEFEDCTFEGILDDPEFPRDEYTDHLQGIDEYCDSKCRNVERITIGNSEYRDLAPLMGTEDSSGLGLNNNAHLDSLHGLEDLETIDNSLIEFNPKLENFEGLESLERIEGRDFITIDTNEGLKSMDGLESLRVIEPTLRITNNKDLEDLRGLESLERIGGNLTIEANARLPECEIDWLVDRVEVEGNVNIDDNGFALEGDGHCE
ncbi:MAG: hypothetical protein ACOCV2_08080 [Persicimonas sp.]